MLQAGSGREWHSSSIVKSGLYSSLLFISEQNLSFCFSWRCFIGMNYGRQLFEDELCANV